MWLCVRRRFPHQLPSSGELQLEPRNNRGGTGQMTSNHAVNDDIIYLLETSTRRLRDGGIPAGQGWTANWNNNVWVGKRCVRYGVNRESRLGFSR